MNTLTCFLKTRLTYLLLLMNVLTSYAQEPTFQQTSQPTEKGYWKFRTDYTSRCTIVWFYNKNHELIYREELPQKYLKPTKRNIRSLNQVLASLQDKRMVASKINSSQLLALGNEKPSGAINFIEDKPLFIVPVSEKVATHVRAVVYASTQSALISVSIENPKEEKVFIRLKHPNDNLIYWGSVNLVEECAALPFFKLNFNLSDLKTNHYKLEVNTSSERYVYNVYVYEDTSGKKVKVEPYQNK